MGFGLRIMGLEAFSVGVIGKGRKDGWHGFA
jgi:hypothetical protein